MLLVPGAAWADEAEDDPSLRFELIEGAIEGSNIVVVDDDEDESLWQIDYTDTPCARDVAIARLLSVAASQAGTTDGDRYQNATVEAGSTFNTMGPCTAYVWWCFNEAGLRDCLMDGAATTYPHELRDWYEERGGFTPAGSYVPRPGDIWLTDNPTGRPFPDASATHSGIVDHVSEDGRTIYVWEHVNGYVHLVVEQADHETLVGYARPVIDG